MSPSGSPLFSLDGHHGGNHAVRWVDDNLRILSDHGIDDCVVIEMTPIEGGSAFTSTLVQKLHALRLETRCRPCGAREIVGLNCIPQPETAIDTKRAIAATPERIHARLHLVHAPAQFADQRRPIRIPRGRMEPPTGAPVTPQEARLRRRIERRSAQK